MNGQELEKEDQLNEETPDEGPERIEFKDKRRFDDSGERVRFDVKERPGKQTAQETQKVRSPEVLKLEQSLKEMTVRCGAAENKLIEVQKRFEKERANLANETAQMRERMKKALAQSAEQGRFDFLITLLPVLDNLNLAIEASGRDASFEHLLEGVKGTARSFTQALLNVGVEPIATVGEHFDPELHEAVEMVETGPENDGKVTAEYAGGYTFQGRLLRPARVQVGRVPETDAPAE